MNALAEAPPTAESDNLFARSAGSLPAGPPAASRQTRLVSDQRPVPLSLDFTLPPELKAHEPAEIRGTGRDDVRLMVSHREDDLVEHAHFRDLPRFLRRGDLLVVNTTATLPAALTARRADGSSIALHYSASLPGGLIVVEPRVADPRDFEVFELPEGVWATLLARCGDSQRLWIARLDLQGTVIDYLHRVGSPIHYSYIDRAFPIDAYQTVYACEEGTAEMPSARPPFTGRILPCLRCSASATTRPVLHS